MSEADRKRRQQILLAGLDVDVDQLTPPMPQEVDEFFGTIRQMVQDGHAIIFISHKLHEVIDISNRVTVLRDGEVVATEPVAGLERDTLVRMMIGRPVASYYPAHLDRTRGAEALRVEAVDPGVSIGPPKLPTWAKPTSSRRASPSSVRCSRRKWAPQDSSRARASRSIRSARLVFPLPAWPARTRNRWSRSTARSFSALTTSWFTT